MINNKEKYWNGNRNKSIRYYFYSQRGLALFNEFRYLFMLIFGAYYTLKLNNPIWLVVMFAISIPVLCCVGWLSVHHIGKVIDWLNIEFATYWSRYQFDLIERQTTALEEINQKTTNTKNDSDKKDFTENRLLDRNMKTIYPGGHVGV